MKILPFQYKNKTKICDIIRKTGFFSEQEIEIAIELLDDYLTNKKSTYIIYVACNNYDNVVGYICFGKTPLSYSTYELYWIAVHPDYQRQGVGRRLIDFFEKYVLEKGGFNILVETSSKKIYEPTRKFYEALGYKILCRVKDFYSPGDDRITYIKILK